MLAKDLISELVPSLKTSDSGIDALNWMEVFRVSHLPIVNNRKFLGLITDIDIYDMNMADEPLGNHALSLFKPYVYYYQHIYDVIEIASRLQLTVVPVLDEDKEYMGLITQADLVKKFSELIAAPTPGGVIELEMPSRDYSLSEIGRVVEDADAKVLSLYVTSNPKQNSLSVILKLNRTDIRPVLHAFDRYGYTVLNSFSSELNADEQVKKNYDALMKYLDL